MNMPTIYALSAKARRWNIINTVACLTETTLFIFLWPDWWAAIAWANAAIIWALKTGTDRHIYKMGWLDGRATMIESLPEALQRGLSPVEWIIAETERDLAMLHGKHHV